MGFHVNYIDLLPDALLVEILCRLPGYKFLYECKCVSKRWSALISNPCFVSSFLRMKIDPKGPPATQRTLINSKGDEMFSSHKSQPLTRLFQSLMCLHGLQQEPVVAGVYKDLLLCCTGVYNERDYYICNPFTQQFVPLPPIPRCKYERKPLPEGFICDLPYYDYKKDDLKGHFLQLNTGYRCKVVRIIGLPYENLTDQFKVQIFSSETSAWKESIVSPPDGFGLWAIDDGTCYTTAHSGMLYWMSMGRFLLGFDPFMIDSDNSSTSTLSCSTAKNSTDGDDIVNTKNEWRFINLFHGVHSNYVILCLGEYGGRLQMSDLCDSPYGYDLVIWDFNEEQSHRAGLACLENMRRYTLDENMYPGYDDGLCEPLALDPNDEYIVYLCVDQEIFMVNLRTGKRLKMAGMREDWCNRFPLVLPLWPTPVPILQQHAQPPLPPPVLNIPTFTAEPFRTPFPAYSSIVAEEELKPLELGTALADIANLANELCDKIEGISTRIPEEIGKAVRSVPRKRKGTRSETSRVVTPEKDVNRRSEKMRRKR